MPDWFQSKFNTNPDVANFNGLPLKEGLVGIGTAAGLVVALSEEPAVDIVAVLAAGIATGLIEAIVDPTQNAIEELGDFQKFVLLLSILRV